MLQCTIANEKRTMEVILIVRHISRKLYSFYTSTYVHQSWYLPWSVRLRFTNKGTYTVAPVSTVAGFGYEGSSVAFYAGFWISYFQNNFIGQFHTHRLLGFCIDQYRYFLPFFQELGASTGFQPGQSVQKFHCPWGVVNRYRLYGYWKEFAFNTNRGKCYLHCSRFFDTAVIVSSFSARPTLLQRAVLFRRAFYYDVKRLPSSLMIIPRLISEVLAIITVEEM